MNLIEFIQSTPVVATVTATLTTGVINIWNTQRINKTNIIKGHYSEFWNDKELESVRTWLANDQAYAEIYPVLVNINKGKKITKEEYACIDKIDKFLNMIMLIREIGQSKIDFKRLIRLFNKKYASTWEELMLEYWLIAPINYQRTEFEAYIKNKYKYNFYPKLVKANSRKIKREK